MQWAQVQANIDALVREWQAEQSERLGRQALDPEDFARLHEAGLTLTGMPVERGGLWRDAASTMLQIGGVLRRLGRVDPSLALVCSMHPTVLSFWLLEPESAPSAPSSWAAQREQVFGSVADGHWFGTIASEPGVGGDIMATKARAVPDGGDGWLLTGDKHMGSGSGVTSFMITIAVPEGEEAPELFLIDTRGLPWDGSQGAFLVRAWDGHGMAATQSHAFRFEGLAVERHAHGHALELAPQAMPIAFYAFTSAIMGVLDAALAEARRRLEPRKETLSAFERVSWTKAVNDIWLANQAFEGMGRALAEGRAMPAVSRGKLAVSELAEAAMLGLSKAIGGASFSRSSPFGQWAQDVRALGFLRPPWPLAYDALFEASFAD